MKIGPVIFFIFHYIIKFMLLTVILTGELLADRNGLMLIYILYFFIFLLTIMMKEQYNTILQVVEIIILIVEILLMIIMIYQSQKFNCWGWLCIILVQAGFVLYIRKRSVFSP